MKTQAANAIHPPATRLVLGLVVGAVVGAGLALWCAPRLLGLRRPLDDSAATVRTPMDDLAEVGDMADELARAADDGAPVSP
jgi:hypothetical protein